MMKKACMMLAVMLTMPFAMMAQTKFHDVEGQEAKGPVKSITNTNLMGQTKIINFTRDGKQEGLENAVYDKDGYLQSSIMEAENMSITFKYTWENGRIKSQSMNTLRQTMTTTSTYDAKGYLASTTSTTSEALSEPITILYTDYKYDARGNWISRKVTFMGQTTENTRTIEYYE